MTGAKYRPAAVIFHGERVFGAVLFFTLLGGGVDLLWGHAGLVNLRAVERRPSVVPNDALFCAAGLGDREHALCRF